MDLNDKTDLFKIQKWIADTEDSARLNKRERELLILLSVVLDSCTPYLGYHGKVEHALATFRENMISQ